MFLVYSSISSLKFAIFLLLITNKETLNILTKILFRMIGTETLRIGSTE